MLMHKKQKTSKNLSDSKKNLKKIPSRQLLAIALIAIRC
jgi:hypothetical protein